MDGIEGKAEGVVEDSVNLADVIFPCLFSISFFEKSQKPSSKSLFFLSLKFEHIK